METQDLVRRLHELADRAGTLSDNRFLTSLAVNVEVQSESVLSATGSVHMGMLAERVYDR